MDPNPDSGAAGTVYHTSQALRRLGHDVDEIWKGDLGRRIRHGNLHYLLELPIAYRNEVAKRCRHSAYDAVMLSQPHAYLAGKYLQRHHPNVVFLNRSHGWEGQVDRIMEALSIEVAEARPVRKAARRAMQHLLFRHQSEVIKWADGIVVGSSPVARYIAETHGYPMERLAILPHGMPGEFLSPPPLAEDSARWRKLLYVGQYTPIKAPDIVAAVFNAVLSVEPRSEAGWVCDTAHHERARSMLSPGVRDRVIMYPWVSQCELPALYDAYGIFIFPSHYEGFGKAPFEAMARGMAIVSSRVGGMADLIQSGRNGYAVEPGDAAEMARLAISLLAAPGEALKLGRNARETAASLTWENTASGIVELTRRLAARKQNGKQARG